jgi:hypothetical protein
VIPHKTSDAAFREGEPPYFSGLSCHRQSPDNAGPNIGFWFGPTSVFCAAVAWICWCLGVWAENNPVLKVIADNYESLGNLLLISLLGALIGGASSGLIWRSSAGYLAFALAAILWISVLSRVYLLCDG